MIPDVICNLITYIQLLHGCQCMCGLAEVVAVNLS